MSEKTNRVKVDLIDLEIRPTRNWYEWLRLWKHATTSDEMLGLLHVGFNVSLERAEHEEVKFSNADRIKFYFAVADGWTHAELLHDKEVMVARERSYDVGRDKYGNRVSKTSSQMRQIIARKAFDILAQNFFKIDLHAGHHGFEGDWESVVASSELLPVIVNFFRTEKGLYTDRTVVRNTESSDREPPSSEMAANFLLTLINFIWKWRKRERDYGTDPSEVAAKNYQDTTEARLNSAKPWSIEVLNFLGRLDKLTGFELDKACVSKLEEIALRAQLSEYQHSVSNSRLARTVEEACYARSRAAAFLLLYRIQQTEHARLSAIKEAEDERERADQKLKVLTRRK